MKDYRIPFSGIRTTHHPDLTHEYVKIQIALSNSQLLFLGSELSFQLVELLPVIGGNSAAVYNSHGYLATSTPPFVNGK